MSRDSDFENELSSVLNTPWGAPPKRAGGRARRRPNVEPVPPPPPKASRHRLRPSDVRSATAEAGATSMISKSFPGIGVTLMVSPPQGDALWSVQGRIWLEEGQSGPVNVVLSAGESVLDATQIEDGGSFDFQELLLGAWALEFHLANDTVHVLQGPEAD